jgi:excisionase family DNA binding protein
MRLEEWYKRLESFERSRHEVVTSEPTPITEADRQPKKHMDEPVQPALNPVYTSPSGAVTILPPDSPTVEASAASETLPAAAQKFAQSAGVEDATFRTASPPKSETKARQPKSARFGDKSSLDLFSQPANIPPPAPPASRESREELMARLLDPILTLEEAAQLLGVCPTTVRRWTNKGVLQHYRTSGNQRRFRLSHVVGFLGDDGGPTKPRKTGTLHDSHEEDRPLLTLSSPDDDEANKSGRGLKASQRA